MNQIPTEGEFCLTCPCRDTATYWCNLYNVPIYRLPNGPIKRLVPCLKDRPQIISRADFKGTQPPDK